MKYSKSPLLKVFLLGTFLIFSILETYAQNPKSKSAFWNQVRFGGGLGLGFTNDGFNAGVSPSAIYQINNQFSAGLNVTFNYAQFRENRSTAYGGSILTLFSPLPFLQLSAELEQLRISRNYTLVGSSNLETDYWAPALYLGLGYSSNFATFGIRYDVLFDNNKSIYARALLPFVRIYF